MNIFAQFRNMMLPVDAIHQALPRQGRVYEVGCGRGTLARVLAEFENKRKVIGIDIDRRKIQTAQSAFKISNLQFVEANAFVFKYQSCNGVIFSDFLHHIPYSQQIVLLKRLHHFLKQKGVLVIKEIDLDDGIRMWLSRIWDYLLYPKDRIYYRSKADWIRLVETLGFSVSCERKVRWFPGSTLLYICQKNLKK